MRDIIRVGVVIVCGGLVGWIAQTQGVPTALAVFAIGVLLTLSNIQEQLNAIARAVDFHFDRLSHLERNERDWDE